MFIPGLWISWNLIRGLPRIRFPCLELQLKTNLKLVEVFRCLAFKISVLVGHERHEFLGPVIGDPQDIGGRGVVGDIGVGIVIEVTAEGPQFFHTRDTDETLDQPAAAAVKGVTLPPPERRMMGGKSFRNVTER